MQTNFEPALEVVRDLQHFQYCVDLIFNRKLSRPRDYRRYFLNILIAATDVYRRHLFLQLTDYAFIPKKIPQEVSIGASVDPWQERDYRIRFRARLTSRDCWQHFRPDQVWIETTKLRTLEDYFHSFTLHLPEMYAEAANTSACMEVLGTAPTSWARSQAAIGLGHFCEHHFLFAHFALSLATSELNWA